MRTYFQFALAAAVIGAASATFVACGSSDEPGDSTLGKGGSTQDAASEKKPTEAGPDSAKEAEPEASDNDTGTEDVVADKQEPIDVDNKDVTPDVPADTTPDVVDDVKDSGPEADVAEDAKEEPLPPHDAGVPFTLAELKGTPGPMAIDDTRVYVFENSAGSPAAISSVKKDGTGYTRLIENTTAMDITVDATHVYWTASAKSTITRIPKDGGTAEPLASTLNNAKGIGVDSTYVYWAAQGNGASQGVVSRRKKDSGSVEDLVPSRDMLMTASLAVDDQYVYWCEDKGVYRANKDGSSVQQVSAAQYPKAITVYQNVIYWGSDTGVGSRVRDLSSAEKPLATNTKPIIGLAVDVGGAFFTVKDSAIDGAVMHVPLTGGTPDIIATGGFDASKYRTNNPQDIVLDSTALYWGSSIKPYMVPNSVVKMVR